MSDITSSSALTCDGVRLGHQAGQTPADGVAVPVGGAGGAGAAGARYTGVWPLYAALVSTHQAVLTVRVNNTLRPAP